MVGGVMLCGGTSLFKWSALCFHGRGGVEPRGHTGHADGSFPQEGRAGHVRVDRRPRLPPPRHLREILRLQCPPVWEVRRMTLPCALIRSISRDWECHQGIIT